MKIKFGISKHLTNILVMITSIVIIIFSLVLKIRAFNNQVTDIDQCAILVENLPEDLKGEVVFNFISNSTKLDKWRYQLEYVMAPTILTLQTASKNPSLYFIDHLSDSILDLSKTRDTLFINEHSDYTLILAK